jgi:type IV secretion system protein VirD4
MVAGKKKVKKTFSEFLEDQTIKREGNDVPDYMSHTERQNANFFFGTKKRSIMSSFDLGTNTTNKQFYIGKPQDRDGHILVIGGVGSGKSSCIAMPTLETWKGTIFAIDIKGELTAHWNKISKTEKRQAKIFNLTNGQKLLSSYDPFYFMRQSGDENLVQNAREIAQAIIPLPPNIQEPFWIQSAQHVLTAVLLQGYSIKASFNATMTRTLTTPIWDLIEEISSGDCLEAIMHISQFRDIDNPADNKMLAGINAELKNKVMVFVTDLQIKDSFTPTENIIKWEDLESCNLFMCIAEDKLGQWDGAISLMLTQLIRTLERRPDKYSEEGKARSLPPILLLLDEFPRLGKVEVIQNAISTLRSKGVTICLMMQSLVQLDRIYGKESRQIIVDNCQYKAILTLLTRRTKKTSAIW